MSRRRKLEKFADLKRFDHVYEMTEPGNPLLFQNIYTKIDMKHQWASYGFGNSNPICLELACGRGEYTVALARRHQHTNYIGVDIKGARIWQGATRVLQQNISNAAFLRIRIEQLELYFAHSEIDEIWITFPDPFPAKENRRLTCPRMLAKYFPLLTSEGKIHLKTDDSELYNYSLQVANESTKYRIITYNDNIYKYPLFTEELEIKTHYEEKHLLDKKTIKYLQLEKID